MTSKNTSEKLLKDGRTFFRKEWIAFLWCFVMALLFWFLKVLEDDYIHQVQIEINYENLPEDRVFTEPLPENILVEIEAPGWQLIRPYIFGKPSPITLNYEKIEEDGGSLNLNQNMQLFQDIIPSEAEIRSFFPESLHFFHEPKAIRIVPVRKNVHVSTASGYGLSGQIEVEPDSIEVQGALSDINEIEYVETEDLQFENLNAHTEQQALLIHDNTQVNFQQNYVQIIIPVERLTEKSVSVPVEILNKDARYGLQLVPDKVQLTFQIPLSLYGDINEDSFDLVVDAARAYRDSLNQLPVKIDSKPDNIQSLRMEPKYLDYYFNVIQ